MITDSHCHLDYPILYEQLDDVIKRAELNQVEKFTYYLHNSRKFRKNKINYK